MELNELLKMAAKKPEVRDALINFANILEKRAASSNATTKFDETVPVMVQPQPSQTSGTGITGTAQQANQTVPNMVDQAPPASTMPMGQQIAAEPMPQQMNPGQEGAMAAQDFLAPIMEAAMQGDQNAQAIIAQAAGHIAKGVAEAAAGVASAPAEAVAPAVDASGVPVAPVSPEEAVANQIVPPQEAKAPASAPEQAGANQPPVKEESGKETKQKEEKKGGVKTEDDKEFKKMSMDFDTVRQLLDLARAGKI